MPPQIFRPSTGTVLVVKRRRSSVCRLAPEGSTLLYVCMHMYLCMYVYVPMYVVPGGCTKVRYLMSACQVKIWSPLYSTYKSIFVLQRKLYLLQIREKLNPLMNLKLMSRIKPTLKFTFYSSGMHNTHIIHTAVIR